MWYLNKIKGQAILAQPFDFNGSAGRTRTCDKVVNSHLLYQLSYVGTKIKNGGLSRARTGDLVVKSHMLYQLS